MGQMSNDQTIPLDRMIACPTCDAIFDTNDYGDEKVACERCHRTLISPSKQAGLRVIILSLASAGLVIGAMTQPFLSIERFFITRDTTLFGAALAFEGPMAVLSLVVLTLVLLLPVLRLLLTLYVVAPLTLGRRPWPHARVAFRISETLRPWSMAEIFALGAAVALIKIVDQAHVSLGPAVWMFAGFVVLMAVQNTLMCRWSLWKALDE